MSRNILLSGKSIIFLSSSHIVHHWCTGVFDKNTDLRRSNLAYISIDFIRKMEYNSYCDKKTSVRAIYIKEWYF